MLTLNWPSIFYITSKLDFYYSDCLHKLQTNGQFHLYVPSGKSKRISYKRQSLHHEHKEETMQCIMYRSRDVYEILIVI